MEVMWCVVLFTDHACLYSSYENVLYAFSLYICICLSGEDEVSFQRHNKALQVEYKKARPNPQVLRELMTTTFAMRHADLFSKAYDVLSVVEKYPFLFLMSIRYYVAMYLRV